MLELLHRRGDWRVCVPGLLDKPTPAMVAAMTVLELLIVLCLSILR